MSRRRVILVYVLLIIGAIVSLIPFYWMVTTSLKAPQEAVQFPPSWIPHTLKFTNYVEAMKVAPFGRYFLNTIFIAISTLIGVLLTTSLAAFSFAFYNYKGKDIVFLSFLAVMMVPMPVYIIPGYLILASFGWLDTYLALIIPWIVSAFNIFFLRQHFKTVPISLLEAAIIDGCTPMGFLWRVALPLVKPAIITITIFNLIASWNSFIWPLVMTNRDIIRPVQVGLAYFMQEESTNYTLLSAASTIVVLPVIILFFIFQKRIMESYMRSGIKE